MPSKTSSTVRDTTTEVGFGRTVIVGAVAGVIASMVMAMFAMVAAATYQHTGFFTPLYHIGSLFIDPSTMMTSMEQAMAGSNFYFSFGPAVVGAIVHMMVGAMYGVLFALIVRAAKLKGTLLVGAGMFYGIAVFAVSAWIGLPLAAAIFSAGDPIANMASMVGYGTFVAEHIMFGVAAALVLLPFSRQLDA
ncbi:MAG: hypothetical protein AB7G47_10495 [Mycolicibacterium sp.]|uniref:hypothetical protein n=1 Tax=Mycolicibacterium sp. TaxID=2320850 RepID=UPI003D0AEF86